MNPMSTIAPAVVTFLITVALMFALRPLAMTINLADTPGGRKHHVGAVPVTGGVAMFIGLLFGIAIVPQLQFGYWYLLLSGGLLVLTGLIDDRYSVPSFVRLIAQSCAAIIMINGGRLLILDVGDPFGFGVLQLGSAAFLFTVIVTITVINAFNFADGIDGLAGSMAFVALLAVAIAGGADTQNTAVAVVACSAIFGFLLFNFPLKANRPLRSFMGDAGSTLLGLIVVWLTVSITQGPGRQLSPIVGLWFVVIPLFDLFSCFIRRALKGKSPLRSGREHFHHLLIRAGLKHRIVLYLLAGLNALYAAIGLLLNHFGASDNLMFTLWAIVGSSQYLMLRRLAISVRRSRWQHFKSAA